MTMPMQKPGRSKQNYATPSNFIKATKRMLGIDAFTFDFAADAENTKADHWWTKENDSLSRSVMEWYFATDGGWGWLNPPFSDIDPWAERCNRLREVGGSVAFLVPAGVGANWFRDHVDGKALVLFLNGRLCFIEDWATTIDPASVKKGTPHFYKSEPLYPKDCILCLYSPMFEPGYQVWTWKDRL